jgi:hypothetical protein
LAFLAANSAKLIAGLPSSTGVAGDTSDSLVVVVRLLDTVNAIIQSLRYDVFIHPLGVNRVIVTLYVPALLVSSALILWQLIRTPGVPGQRPGARRAALRKQPGFPLPGRSARTEPGSPRPSRASSMIRSCLLVA